MSDRDFDARPYSSDEQRVAKFIVEITEGVVGGGDDPIGFLLALVMQYRNRACGDGVSRSTLRRLVHSTGNPPR